MIVCADALIHLKTLPEASVDAVVTDPPYGLGAPPPIEEVLTAWLAGAIYQPRGKGFMGKEWDAFVPGPEVWRECLRVLKPGGHLLAFFGTRTYDVGALAVRLAGFEIRDQIAWLYGQGFPKSIDVSKAIDKAAGAERDVVKRCSGGIAGGTGRHAGMDKAYGYSAEYSITAPATPEAQAWEGWGSALKPAQEPIVLARKPFSGPLYRNVLEHGVGAINVDGCRIGTSGGGTRCTNRDPNGRCLGHNNAGRSTSGETFHGPDTTGGRWPANVVLDEEAGEMLDVQSGERQSGGWPGKRAGIGFRGQERGTESDRRDGDTGGASRFFYCAKASTAERDAGLEGGKNVHPTVKPLALMRWLVRLVTPPGGLVLDPFTGSGTTGLAACTENFRFLGIERDPSYAEIARARLAAAGRRD